MNKIIYIDPGYSVHCENKLFEAMDNNINRDNRLEPFRRMRQEQEAKGNIVKTGDYLLKDKYYDNDNYKNYTIDYYSFGLTNNLDYIIDLYKQKKINLKAFVIAEPPMVAPGQYKLLPKLSKYFENIYLFNTEGDGYNLDNVNTSKLRKQYVEQAYNTVIEQYWKNKNRKDQLIIINSKLKPQSRNKQELYSTRINLIKELSKFNYIDLYGRGWEELIKRSSLWLPYIINYKTLMSVYKGSCVDKYKVLSQYKFSLSLENMHMNGFLSDRLFDSIFAGTVPIYLGAKDVDKIIPNNIFIDLRNFASVKDLINYLNNMSQDQIDEFKYNGRKYIESADYNKFYNAISNMVM